MSTQLRASYHHGHIIGTKGCRTGKATALVLSAVRQQPSGHNNQAFLAWLLCPEGLTILGSREVNSISPSNRPSGSQIFSTWQ